MVLAAASYNDFTNVVSRLLGASETPIVFDVTDGDFWWAWAVIPSKTAVVWVTLSTGAPAGFTTDYPSHTSLDGTIQVQ